jgi:hypothetical protein
MVVPIVLTQSTGLEIVISLLSTPNSNSTKELEYDVPKSQESLLWAEFIDEAGRYLLNVYYPSEHAITVQGWYFCEIPWIRGSRLVLDL